MEYSPFDYEAVFADYPAIVYLYRELHRLINQSTDLDFCMGAQEVLARYNQFGAVINELGPETVAIINEGAAHVVIYFSTIALMNCPIEQELRKGEARH